MPVVGLKVVDWRMWLSAVALYALFSIAAQAADEKESSDVQSQSGFQIDLKFPTPKIKFPHIELPLFWNDDLKTGREAYAAGDYATALSAFLRATEDGNMIAEWYLGHMHRLGRGVPVNAAIAYSYFRRVADHYDPNETGQGRLRVAIDARIRIADFLRLGIPAAKLAPNPQHAARIYLEFATTYGHPRALFGLGVMSIEGEGMRKNPKQGLKWLRAAARKHSPEAAAYLGDMFNNGTVVPKDNVRGLSWYIVASHMTNKTESPQIFAKLDQISFAASDEERLEAEASARIWNEQNPAPVR